MKIWKKKIKAIIKNRRLIIKALFKYIFLRAKYYKTSRERLAICRSNICGFYDKHGKSEMAIFNNGAESCAICGCKLKLKVIEIECECALSEIEEEPLWKAIKEENYGSII